MKEYEGKARPSGMVFDKVDLWVRVVDLPPDKRTEAFGKALGNWLGEVVKADADKDGIARGNQLWIRAKIDVYEPLIHGFYLKKSKEEKLGTWFDFYYEKVPHFFFEYGRLVHRAGFCEPPIDSSSQWGGWLRASPGRNTSKDTSAGGATSSGNSRSHSMYDDGTRQGHRDEQVRVRDIPTKRNLNSQFSQSAENRTGGQSKPRDGEVNSPRCDKTKGADGGEHDLREGLEMRREQNLRDKLIDTNLERERRYARDVSWERKGKDSVEFPPRGHHAHAYDRADQPRGAGVHRQDGRRRGYYVRKPRQSPAYDHCESQRDRISFENRKRRPWKVRVAKGDIDRIHEQDACIRDTRRKTSTMFDRISDNMDRSADPEERGLPEQ
ncbi:uncharacterized protein [Triticum aestivum]|uniref:uncharacterized protein n=1 Tax=Triticum aestivum TaxID=4565 RepID=UPI001D023380|nr:uncharacterized protein LOC123161113 [Triticum aestivum]